MLRLGPLLLLLCFTGCGTVANFFPGEERMVDSPGYRVYGGLRYDWEVLAKTDGWGHPDLSWFFKPIFFIDLPLSLALDTVTLPATIIIALSGDDVPEPPPEKRDSGDH